MPTWGQVLAALKATRTPQDHLDFDGVRRKYLASLAAYTGRSTIVYASDYLT